MLVPFGGAEHDWAALELGAWIASATGAPLRLLGAAGQTEERTRVTRLLGDAGLLVQQYAGIRPSRWSPSPARERARGRRGRRPARHRPVGALAQGGPRPDALGDRQAAPAPMLFVRRGLRPGALAPRGDVTRFTWSAVTNGSKPSNAPVGSDLS